MVNEDTLNETLEEIKRELEEWLKKTETIVDKIMKENSNKPIILTRSRISLKALQFILPIISRLV